MIEDFHQQKYNDIKRKLNAAEQVGVKTLIFLSLLQLNDCLVKRSLKKQV
jgi:hypothetical protein